MEIREQLMSICRNEEVNPRFISIVLRFALEQGYRELAHFIREYPEKYIQLVRNLEV